MIFLVVSRFGSRAESSRSSGSEGMNADDETQFLNYILTKFANSQPEMQ
jgi:hypothetical protein